MITNPNSPDGAPPSRHLPRGPAAAELDPERIIAEQFRRARAHLGHIHGLEVEVDDLDQLGEALAAGAGVVLLDNMDAATIRAAVELVAGRAVVEVSGGVTLERVRELAATGADVLSAGALTTRAPWLDLALDLET